MMVRTACEYLLGAGDLDRYRELYDEDDDENRQTEWAELLKKFDPNDEDVESSDFEGQANLRGDFENNLKVMSERVITYHQLKAYSLYLEDKPVELTAYHEFLVSVFSMVLVLYCVLLSLRYHWGLVRLSKEDVNPPTQNTHWD